jgi:transposase
MAIVADRYAFVVGVDTHAAAHHYALIDARTGGVIDDRAFPTTPAGLGRALNWVIDRTGPATGGLVEQVLISMEGTRSYGAQAAVVFAEAGYRVTDAPTPKRERGAGKNDHLDAITAARGILGKEVDRLADARAGQTSTLLQILLTARNAMTSERTRAINALTALLRVHDLGIDARRALSSQTITTIAAWRRRAGDTPAQAAARTEAIRLARRVGDLNTDVKANEAALRAAVTEAMPSLLEMVGIGPVNAAIVLATWSHPGRVRNDAAFAKLAGACPLEISSGRRHEHRLNRTGDRQLNRALHTIANTRMRYEPRTRDYVERRTAQGLTGPRIRRCLKRYIARELHQHLATMT